MYQSLSLADRIWLNQEEDFPNLKGRTAGQGAGGCGLLETGSSARSKLIFLMENFCRRTLFTQLTLLSAVGLSNP